MTESTPVPEEPGTTVGFEAARDELTAVVAALEAGGLTLEESLRLWERGEELAGICQAWLTAARVRLDRVVADPTNGGPADTSPDGT